jgi:hypothetical protein
LISPGDVNICETYFDGAVGAHRNRSVEKMDTSYVKKRIHQMK